jgi:two-component sensor histidine kinase
MPDGRDAIPLQGHALARHIPFSALDMSVTRLHRQVFIRRRALTFPTSIAIYVLVVLFAGSHLEISSNYFVILPVLVASLCYGIPGGLVAGALGLPANLLLFALIGHPEYSPASKAIAEASGVVVGLALGYLSHYYRELETEISRRIPIEDSLRRALAEKELLLQELHHRVKNNLNVIKSLVQLQRNRSSDPAFREAADRLIERIFTIALVHEQLYRRDDNVLTVNLEEYVGALVANVVAGYASTDVEVVHSVRTGERRISPDVASPLGLIINEVLTNALKHAACCVGEPVIVLTLDIADDDFRLVIRDNGPGFDPLRIEEKGLGLKLVKALARQLDGKLNFEQAQYPMRGADDSVGARFELRWSAGSLPADRASHEV